MKYFLSIKICAWLSVCLLLAGCASPNTKHAALDAAFPAAPSAPVDQVLGVGDTVDITVYRNTDLTKSVKIDKSGKFMFPLVGDVRAVDRTVYSVRDELQEKLSKFIVNPQITLNVSSTQSQKVLTLGEVKSPGVFTLEVDLQVTDVVAKAGGFTSDADAAEILVIRKTAGKMETVKFDMKNALHAGDFSNNVSLKNGDIVYVPTHSISNVAWFMSKISAILSPVVATESAIILWPQVVDVLKGKKPTNTNVNITP
jgi:polysaccharide export outer membrane protein